VLPGLIDPHLHLFGLAARDLHFDASGFDDVAALLAALQRHAADLPRGAWVRGDGLDEARLGRLPRAAELDRAAGGRPVRLRHRSRHASVLSSSALARLPAGLVGVERSGLVAGVERDVGAIVGPLPVDRLVRGFATASRTLAAMGITTIADATPRRWAELAPLRRALASGALAQRVFAMRPWDDGGWRPRGRLAPGPVKILVEETPSGLDPTPTELARRIAVAAARGAQVAVHCVGAATLVAALDAFARLPRRHRRGRRHRLEHLGECPPPLVARIAALGLVVVTNPAFVYWRGDVYRQETDGAARAWLYRARSLVDAGVPVAAASDAPVVEANPWIGMAAARTRRTRGGHVLGPRERVGAAEALAMHTVHAARALRADRLGVLAPGVPADVIVVTPDPLTADETALRETSVRLTMIGGRIVWRA
jgi:predicted amidohydrolase YtcJ